jgi:hypothetical protein
VEVEIDGSLRLLESTAKHPLPERLPLIQEADDTYRILSYEADQDCPGRTNGTIYSNFTAGSWCDVVLVEPVAIH